MTFTHCGRPEVKKAYFTFPSPEWTHVSQDAKGLIEMMLTLKEEDRISAEGVRANMFLLG